MNDTGVEIKSEARGGHWVAWMERPGQAAPAGGIIMVGQTREEAEARMRGWWAEQGR